MNQQRKFIFSIIAFFGTLLLAGYQLQNSMAQTDNKLWDPPTNLSRSGSTADPAIIIDNNSRVHVIWQDDYDGIIYSRLEEDQWSEPVTVEFPFTSTIINFINTNDDYIHAFWADLSDSGEHDSLFYSRVLASEFGNANAWGTPIVVSEAVTSFGVYVNEDGVMHLAFIQPLETEEFPSGLYYRQSVNGGISWTPSSLLFQSLYFRGLSAQEINISIATASTDGSNQVFIVWDNLSHRRVYIAHSNDDGTNWDTPVDFDHSEIELGSTIPFDPKVIVFGDQIILKWQVEDPDGNCIHYYKLSNDGGSTWSDRAKMMGEIEGCAQDSNFFPQGEEYLLLQMTIQDQVYLLAWDGFRWSDPQLQLSLSRFIDPDTSRYVYFGCPKFDYLAAEDRLISVGCEVNLESIGIGDIWLTSLAIGDKTDWFPPPSKWVVPEEITSIEGEISSPVMINDFGDIAHLFWIQKSGDNPEDLNSNIYYSNWDDENWVPPTQLFERYSNEAAHPSVSINQNGVMYLVWSDIQSGELFFSLTDSELASREIEWFEPRVLLTHGLVARSPSIYIDPSGMINVAYVVPLNAGRGIYLTQSDDRGNTWNEPVLVFDAEDANWEMIGPPSIAGTVGGVMHIMWTRNTLPDGRGPLTLYYAASEDGGFTWSTPEIVVDVTVDWYQLLSYGEQTVHRFWQETIQGYSFIYHQVSYDNGLSWGTATSISSSGIASGGPAVTIDNAGNLHLLQIIIEDEDTSLLRNWQWDGEQWSAGEVLNVGESKDKIFLGIAASVSSTGSLRTAYSVADYESDDIEYDSGIHFTSRYIGDLFITEPPLDASDNTALPTIDNTETPTSSPTPTQTPISTMTPSPTPIEDLDTPAATEILASIEPDSPNSSSRMNIIYGITISVVIFVAILGGYIYRRNRTNQI